MLLYSQSLVQDLNLGDNTHAVSFTRVTNLMSDPRYVAGGSGGAVQATSMPIMVSNGQETCILIPFSTLLINYC